MKHRKLRIAWTVAWGVVCLSLIALWIRSYYYHFHVECTGSGRATVFSAQSGQFVFSELYGGWGTRHWFSTFARILPAAPTEIRRGFYIHRHAIGYSVGIPNWFAALLSATLAALPWLYRSFSLRTLLICMSVVATGLGFIVCGIRR